MSPPIIDDVLTASILGRQAIAAIEVVAIPAFASLAALLRCVATTLLTACTLRRVLRLLGAGMPLLPGLLSTPLFIASGMICMSILVLLGKRQAAETH